MTIKVGDKVEFVEKFGTYEIGDVVEVTSFINDNHIRFLGKNGKGDCLCQRVKAVKPTKNQRITALEKEVAELKIIVEGMRERKAIVTTVTVEEEVTDFLTEPKSQNQQRAEIIEKAKKFVNENVSLGRTSDRPKIGNITYREHYYDVDFSVKGKKVTAVIWHLSFNEKRQPKPAKIGRTKCHPISVFNEHIGKAIALGRALGLDVSEFEQAVQPDEVVLGMKVRNEKDWLQAAGGPIYKGEIYQTAKKTGFNECMVGSGIAQNSTIINDTNAIYGEVE